MPGFDPDQPRDEKGQWTAGDAGGAIKAAASEQLKLFEVPELTPLELLKAGKFHEVKVMNITEAQAAIEKYKETLTEDEKYYVTQYTSPGNFYSDLNRSLRQGHDDMVDQDALKNLDSFLDEAPKFVGETYRGLMFRSSDGYNSFKNDLLDDAIIVDMAYSSTSVRQSAADNVFTAAHDQSMNSVRLHIKGKSGVYLNGLSELPTEEEVLFRRETKFRVLKTEEVDKQHGTGKFLTAYLEEITEE